MRRPEEMLYFDTSFLVPLILPEATSEAIAEFFHEQPADSLTVSHWTRVEFFSAIAREFRMGRLDQAAASRANARFEMMLDESFIVLLPDTEDFILAKDYLCNFETGLRAGDALHLAIAANHHATRIYSLDLLLIGAGKVLGLPVTAGIHVLEC
jgi:uncharacterized protein